MGDIGVKDYKGKRRWSLVPWKALEGMVRVLEYGAVTKYVPNNWKFVKQKASYVDAVIRHFFAYTDGEEFDPETGESHLSHIMCDISFLEYDRMHRKEGMPFAEYMNNLLNYFDYKQEVIQASVDNKEYRIKKGE